MEYIWRGKKLERPGQNTSIGYFEDAASAGRRVAQALCHCLRDEPLPRFDRAKRDGGKLAEMTLAERLASSTALKHLSEREFRDFLSQGEAIPSYGYRC